VSEAEISDESAVALISSRRSAVRETYLTQREFEILRLVANGKTSVTIAEEISIGPATVDNHSHHILRKLSAHSRLEAVLRAEHSGLL
jgi:DNA-binding NarL/FixJ family response regulator